MFVTLLMVGTGILLAGGPAWLAVMLIVAGILIAGFEVADQHDRNRVQQ